MGNALTKADLFKGTAHYLHDNYRYLSVPHNSYYCCYQLLRRIWLESMSKNQDQLDSECSQTNVGSHNYLTNQVVAHIMNSQKRDSLQDSRTIRDKLKQLKRLREQADYYDDNFTIDQSNQALSLMRDIEPLLKKY